MVLGEDKDYARLESLGDQRGPLQQVCISLCNLCND